MLVLDTDHFSELERNLVPGKRLAGRLNAGGADKALTVVTPRKEQSTREQFQTKR